MRPELNQIRSLNEPLLDNRWAIFFPKIPLQGSAFALPNDFNLLCESVTIPKMKTSNITTKIRQFQTTSPGISVPDGPINIIFNDTIDLKITNFFLAWERSCSDPIFGKVGNKKSKIIDGSSLRNIEAIISLFYLDNNNNPLLSYVLFGCILDSFNPGGFKNNGALIKPSVNISFDYFVTKEVGVSSISDIINSIVDNFSSIRDFVSNFGI
jgi:hypothetical protein